MCASLAEVPSLNPFHHAMVLCAATALAPGCYQGGPNGPDDNEPPTRAGDGGDDSGGDDDDDDDDNDDGWSDVDPESCTDEPQAASRPLRILTPLELRASYAALLQLPDFSPTYDLVTDVGLREVRQLRDDAEAAVDRIDEWPPALVPCDFNGPEDTECPDELIEALGTAAFRRPLLPGEHSWLRSVYDDARAQVEFSDAMEVLAETILQAPAILYLEEQGVDPGDGGPVVALEDYALASRLSFFLWGGPPDQALLDEADAGSLRTNEGIRAAVERMLDDPRATTTLAASVWHALHLDGGESHFGLMEAAKMPDLYPEYGLGLQFSIATEFEAFVADVLAGPATFEALLTSRRAYVDERMAALYGLPDVGLSDGEWRWVDLPEGERAGLLTRAAFLTVFASTAAQSPIRRGAITLEDMLCFELGSPPPDVDDSPVDGHDDPSGPMTVREATDARTEGAECSGCHSIINPVGYAFEHYDAIGRWQDDEVVSGLEVDASGELKVSDVSGPFSDAVDLSAMLANSTDARGCFAERWLSAGVGGALGELDACSRDRLIAGFSQTGDLRELVVQVALSDSFRHINLDPPSDQD